MFRYVIAMLALVAAACGAEDSSDPVVVQTNGGTTTSTNNGQMPDVGSPTEDMSETPDMGGTDEDMNVDEPDMVGNTNNVGYPQPPLPWPRETSVTNDVDSNLAALLEKNRIEGACDAWEAGARDEETKLLCGKWMFFYETFGTLGVPQPIIRFAQDFYQDYYGAGFSNFGFVPEPNHPDNLPIGLAPTTAKLGDVDTLAFTCAACHFGQTPDGRYAVGYGNMDLDYGRFLAGLGAPLNLSISENSQDVHPDLKAELLPYVQANKQDSTYMLAVAGVGIQLLNTGADGTTPLDEQERMLALLPGTMDFLTDPLLDDGVWTVSRTLSLWNMPTAEMRTMAGMDHEYLSWTGGTPTLEVFIEGFVRLGLADQSSWTADRVEPLAAYIRSLRAPEKLQSVDQAAADRGRAAFADNGCVDCHSGPSGESATTYTYAELGVDAEMANIFAPNPDGTLCCGFQSGPDYYIVTGGLKAPRMAGMETRGKWLHNGSVPSLESLLCLEPRPNTSLLAQTAGGHEYGCDLDQEVRRDLIEYMRSL